MHPQPLTPHRTSPSRSPGRWTWYDSLELGAYPSAPGRVRGHVGNVLREWGLKEYTDVVELVVSELASNAVQATRALAWIGRRPPIRVCLHGRPARYGAACRDSAHYDGIPYGSTHYDSAPHDSPHDSAPRDTAPHDSAHYGNAHYAGGVLILVWDAVGGCPVPRDAGPDEENGRGLAIVNALSADWGHYHPLPKGTEYDGRDKVTWAHVTTW